MKSKKFTITFIIVFLSIFLITPVISYFAIFKIQNFAFYQLYKYQVKKMQNPKNNYELVFLGDSALGNAVDADYFTEISGVKAANLALTGVYGFAGSYNFLKETYRHQKNLKYVVLVHYPGIGSQGDPFTGYIYSFLDPDFRDLKNFSTREKLDLLYYSYIFFFNFENYKRFFRGIALHYLGSGNEEGFIVSDYVKQYKKIEFDEKNANGDSPQSILKDGFIFLKKIADFCQKNNLKLLFVYGTQYEKYFDLSTDYMAQLNQLIKDQNVLLEEEPVKIPLKKVGDSLNHVDIPYKKEFTKIYYDRIKNHWDLKNTP